jgi:uncharacterized protein DUF3516
MPRSPAVALAPSIFQSRQWDLNTFKRLIGAPPEHLVSRFQVSHGMLLNVLSRRGDGCRAMQRLLRDSHETDVVKAALRKRAWQLFRSLVARGVVEFIPRTDEGTKLRVNVDLQNDFSMDQTLSLYLIETLPQLDAASPEYALDVLTLVESILENPELFLGRQLDRIKDRARRRRPMASSTSSAWRSSRSSNTPSLSATSSTRRSTRSLTRIRGSAKRTSAPSRSRARCSRTSAPSTVYWIPLYEILNARGLEVYLVNGRHTKNLPGRKTDVQESQWLLKLHTYGLLRNSFHPLGRHPYRAYVLAPTWWSRAGRQHVHPTHAEGADPNERPTRPCH